MKPLVKNVCPANSTTETYAMACPSEVDVPRPSSSRATSELQVADDCIHHQVHIQRENA